MLTYSQAFYELKKKLEALYDERESASIAHELINHVTGLNKTQRLLQKETTFTEQQQEQYEQANTELLNGRPLQYVVGSAWFMGREYQVNEHVLIPRPETEELVQWIIDNNPNQKSKIKNQKSKILDIGTGSGCIPISLKLVLPQAEITTCDISEDALLVAKENAKRLRADIQLVQLDFLDATQHNKLPAYDVIVSNPPYIPISEKGKIHINVREHEPGIALFVPGGDPLLFYRAIAMFGKEHLNGNGHIYCELEADHAMECKALFEAHGYEEAEIRRDIHGNWRMLRAGKSPTLASNVKQ